MNWPSVLETCRYKSERSERASF